MKRNYRRKKQERSRREGERIRESKYNIHYKNIAKEEDVETRSKQGNTGKKREKKDADYVKGKKKT